MKHRGSFPHSMDAPDRHKGQGDVSLCPSVRSFVRLLDEVWHKIQEWKTQEENGIRLALKGRMNETEKSGPAKSVVWLVS